MISIDLPGNYPDIKVAYAVIKGINNLKLSERLESEKRLAEGYIRSKYSDYRNLDAIKKYNRFFLQFQKTFPVEFQIKSIVNGKKIPAANAIVEAMFIAELKNIFLTAAHDIDRINGPLTTKLSIGTVKYTNISGREMLILPGDIITSDEKKIISSVLCGPDFETKIKEDTKDALFFSYFPYGEDDTAIRGHFNDILNNIRLFSENVKGISEMRVIKH